MSMEHEKTLLSTLNSLCYSLSANPDDYADSSLYRQIAQCHNEARRVMTTWTGEHYNTLEQQHALNQQEEAPDVQKLD